MIGQDKDILGRALEKMSEDDRVLRQRANRTRARIHVLEKVMKEEQVTAAEAIDLYDNIPKITHGYPDQALRRALGVITVPDAE